MILDGLRLAVGTLTVVPVRPPSVVDRRTARWAMLLAPVAVLPLGLAVGLVLWLGTHFGLPVNPVAFIAVGVLALGSRAIHLDGLSDVADGLTASYDRHRSLAVMKSGTSGPAGTVALIVVLAVQALSIGTFGVQLDASRCVVVGVLVCLSRCALLITCVRGIPAARDDGLGSPMAGCVPRTALVLGWLVVAAVVEALVRWDDPYVANDRGLIAVAVAVVVTCALVLRCVRRLGGVTGDVYGAAIEVTLAVLLLGTTSTTLFIAS